MKTTKLKELNACSTAIDYVRKQKSQKSAWENCERGDWMLWLANKMGIDDQKLTLAKALCVKQVEHLLTNQRSIDALQGCFDYADGKITREELDFLAAAAHAPDAYSSYTASVAVYAAANSDIYSNTNANYTAAGYAADAAYSSSRDSDYARKESLKKSADICREVFGDLVLLKYRKNK